MVPDVDAIDEIENLDPLEGFIIHEDGIVKVEDEEYDAEENEDLFEDKNDTASEIDLTLEDEKEKVQEDYKVRSKDIVNAIRFF